MSAPFRPATTKVGMQPTRLPAGDARDRMMRLAQRASEYFSRDARAATQERTRRGCQLMAKLADGAACAIVDLASAEWRAGHAERQLSVSRQLTAQLQERADRAEHELTLALARLHVLECTLRSEFDEPTVNRTTPSEVFPEGSKPGGAR